MRARYIHNRRLKERLPAASYTYSAIANNCKLTFIYRFFQSNPWMVWIFVVSELRCCRCRILNRSQMQSQSDHESQWLRLTYFAGQCDNAGVRDAFGCREEVEETGNVGYKNVHLHNDDYSGIFNRKLLAIEFFIAVIHSCIRVFFCTIMFFLFFVRHMVKYLSSCW